MDKTVFDKIYLLQDQIRNDSAYQQVLAEHERLNAELLNQLDTMNESQRNAVLDYCGVLVEMHLKILEYSIQTQ